MSHLKTDAKREITLSSLVGKHEMTGLNIGIMDIERYGSKETCNFVDICLDNTVYRFLEDPDDGYRSYMRSILIIPRRLAKLTDTGRVKLICSLQDDDILDMVDIVTNKSVLKVGTDYSDDYYPSCVMSYYPENMTQIKKTTKQNKKKLSQNNSVAVYIRRPPSSIN